MAIQVSELRHPIAVAEETLPAALYQVVSGRVQGVGFRPFVYRLARSLDLTGWVRNSIGQVEIRIQGDHHDLQVFTHRLFQDAPPLSAPKLESCVAVEPEELTDFSIRQSIDTGESRIHVPPDLFTCDDCLAELTDPTDRRYRYPFINCTQCGPRYTLIQSLPYDRAATTMAAFELCEACRGEYEDPDDRRYHAEPLACPACGPKLEFHHPGKPPVQGNEKAITACVEILRAGGIVAVKGIGGYHLMCDACSDEAISRLRSRKPRPHKPLAVMFPAPSGQPLKGVNRNVYLSREQADMLLSPSRPIVLASSRPTGCLSALIAPGLAEIGVMLPYSPLHHLLLNEFAAPLVASSANISGEPVLTENSSVENRLDRIADAFLHHNRPIQRPADDPVFRVIQDRLRPLRLGRGCTPMEHELPFSLAKPLLAVGGHMKNTIALAWENRIVVSPHIGDMGNVRSLEVFKQTIQDLQSLYNVNAEVVICDAHPGYISTHWAERSGLPVHKVFHHHAHAAIACNTEIETDNRLVFTWDGAGYGEDGTLWGGEALLGNPGDWQRFASLRPFHLPGGERAGREPWRSAAALCWETDRNYPHPSEDARLLHHAWQRQLNTPRSSAAGRLFDAAAALTGLCSVASFEGQGPMLLEAMSNGHDDYVSLPLTQNAAGLWLTDWEPLLGVLLDESRTVADRSACFHSSMANSILQQARQARIDHGIRCIGLSGGVFQNNILTEQVFILLENDGFRVSLPETIPVNDAGISFGQVIEYAMSGS